MSRRSQNFRRKHGLVVDYVDGIVRLECPTKHVIAYLWQPDTDAGRTYLLDEHKRNRRELPYPGPLRFSCATCLHGGTRHNLLLNVERAAEIADAARQDRTRETHVHILGGKQC